MTTATTELPWRRLLLGSLSHLGLRASFLLLGLVTAPLLARHLGPGRFGVLTLALVVSSLVAAVGDLGLPALAGRDLPAVAEDRRSAWLEAFWRARWGAALLVTAASALGAVVLLDGEVRLAVLAALAGVPACLCTSAASAVFGAGLDPGRSAVAEGVGRVAVVVGTVAVVVTGGGVAAVALAMTTGQWLGALCSAGMARRSGLRHDAGSIRQPWARSLIAPALPLAVIPVVGLLYARSDTFVLAVVAGKADLGVYGVMYRILEAVLGLVAVGSALLVPVMTASVDRSVQRARYRQGQRALFSAFLPVAIAAGACGGSLLHLLGGSEYLALRWPTTWGGPESALAMLMGALALMVVNTTHGAAMVAHRRAGLLIRHLVVMLSVNVVLTVWLAQRWSYVGAAVATLVTEVIAALVWSSRVVRRLVVRPALLSNLGRAVASGATMVLALAATEALPDPVRLTLGGVVYVTALWVGRARVPAPPAGTALPAGCFTTAAGQRRGSDDR